MIFTVKIDYCENGQKFHDACVYFDAGDYFEAHETWEDLWNEAQGPRHAYLQGLIQVAVALHHAGTGNLKGTKKLFASALNYLEKGREAADEVDVEELRDLCLTFLNAVEDPSGSAELPYFKLPLR